MAKFVAQAVSRHPYVWIEAFVTLLHCFYLNVSFVGSLVIF